MILGSMELYRGGHTAHRHVTTQIGIEICIVVLDLGLSHCQCKYIHHNEEPQ